MLCYRMAWYTINFHNHVQIRFVFIYSKSKKAKKKTNANKDNNNYKPNTINVRFFDEVFWEGKATKKDKLNWFEVSECEQNLSFTNIYLLKWLMDFEVMLSWKKIYLIAIKARRSEMGFVKRLKFSHLKLSNRRENPRSIAETDHRPG